MAFEELVARHRDRVYGRAYSIVRNVELAVDLSQDAWVKAWRKLAQFQGESTFVTWLTRITVNLCLDELRRQKRIRTDSLEAIEEEIGSVEWRMQLDEVDPTEGLTRVEQRKVIDQALGQLSDSHRTVLVLYEFEQLEYKQIADRMGTSIGTVMSRLYYARRHIASILRRTLKR